jgi:small conductance mechanosensitive channel
MDEPVSQLLSFGDVMMDYANAAIAVLPAIGIALVVLVASIFASNLARHIVIKLVSRAVEDKSLQSLFGTIAKIAVVLIGLFASAAIIFPGLSAGHLVSVLGLSSVAIGFAFRDIFENFLAGILILSGRPFTIGDAVLTNGHEGVVEHISIRNTNIKTYDGQLVIIPNSMIFTNPMTVRTAFDKRRFSFGTGIGYDEDIEQGREVILETVKSCESVLAEPAPDVLVSGHGDSSVNFEIRFWSSAPPAAVKDEVATAVKYALDEAGIEIPYPYRTVEFFDMTKESAPATSEPAASTAPA